MGLFSGYHFINGDEVSPSGPAVVPAEIGEARPVGPGPILPVPAAPTQAISREPAGDARLESTLTELRNQLTAEQALNRRSRDALVALANLVCQAALEDERRARGDAFVNGWSPLQACQFITDQVRPLAAALRPGTVEGLLAEHLKLVQAHQVLQRQHDTLKETVQRQAAAAAKPAPATPADSDVPGPTAESHGAMPATPSANAERITDLVKLIAANGVARYSKLRERLAALWGLDVRSGSLRAALDAAAAQGLLKLYEIKSDWQGSANVLFVELTPTGLERARSAGVTPVRNELADGLEAGLTLAHIHLVLRAAELLKAAGYQRVATFPKGPTVSEAPDYRPMVSAVDGDGQRVFVECERTKTAGGQAERWVRAARAGLGCLHLMTTSPGMQDVLVSEINVVRMQHTFRVRAANVVDVLKRKPATIGDLWSYDR